TRHVGAEPPGPLRLRHHDGIDHYSVQGAFGLALVLLSLLAALRPRDVAPFVPVCAGIAAAYLGLVSLAWQDAAGGLSRAWSGLAIAWGLSLVGAALADRVRRLAEKLRC
ncbi:MAG TPA: hypothetical protein VFO97_02890, partial [Desertimonas sp.]|nr:hypothetical protein [Desertimonas sp.]